MIFELAQDFADAITQMPAEHPRSEVLLLLEEAIRGDMAFLQECPASLFQTMRNSLAVEQPGENAVLAGLFDTWNAQVDGRPYLLSINSPSRLAGPLRRQLNTPHFQIRSLAVLPDESQFATAGSDGSICLWDRGTQTLRQQIPAHDRAINSLAVHPQRQFLLSASNDGSVRISYWMSEFSEILMARENPCFSVTISPDGRLLAAGWEDGTIRLWPLAEHERHLTISGLDDCVRSLTFSNDSALLAAGTDEVEIFVWDVVSHDQPQLRNRFAAHTGESRDVVRYINDLLFLENDRLLCSASSDRSAYIWDWQNGTVRHVLTGHETGVFAVACQDDGAEIATGSSDNTIRIWEKPFAACRDVLLGHEGSVTGLRYLNRRRLLSVSADRTIREWSMVDDHRKLAAGEQHPRACCVCISQAGDFAVAGHADGTVTVWDSSAAACIASQKVSDRSITQVAISRDGLNIVAGSEDGGLWLLMPRLETVFQEGGSEQLGPVESVAISGGGDVVVAGHSRAQDSHSTILIWRPNEKTQVGTIHHDRSAKHVAVAVDDNGTLVAVGSYGRVTIHQVSSQDVVGEFTEFNGEVTDLAFGDPASRIAIATKYATRVVMVDQPKSWKLLPRGGPAKAIARPGDFPFRLTLGSNNSLWCSTADGTIWGGLPGVPDHFDLSAGQSPFLVRIEGNALAFYRWL